MNFRRICININFLKITLVSKDLIRWGTFINNIFNSNHLEFTLQDIKRSFECYWNMKIYRISPDSVRNSSTVTTLFRSLIPFEIIPSMSDVICHLNAESFITLELFHWWFVSHRVNDGPLRRCHGSKTTEWNIYWICHCTGAQSSLKVSNHSFWP